MTSETGRPSSKGAAESNYSSPGGGKGQQQAAMDSARESISGAAKQAGTKVVSGINSQKARAAEGLGNVAQALRQSGETLESKDPQTPLTQYIGSAADQLERLSGYLRENSVSDMVNGVEQFARRQPALFIGSAFMLGLLGARFLKSSSRSEGSGDSYGAYNYEGGQASRRTSSVRGQGYDPRTSAGYWRNQEARDAMEGRSDFGGSGTGGGTLTGGGSTSGGSASGGGSRTGGEHF